MNCSRFLVSPSISRLSENQPHARSGKTETAAEFVLQKTAIGKMHDFRPLATENKRGWLNSVLAHGKHIEALLASRAARRMFF